MTIPWMMNCEHSEDGWCLSCVTILGNDASARREEIAILRAKLAEAERERDAFGRCVSDTRAVLSAKIEEVTRDRDAAEAKAERLEKQLAISHANEACDCTYLREVDAYGDQIVIPCEIHKAHDEKLVAKGRREGRESDAALVRKLKEAQPMAGWLYHKVCDEIVEAIDAEIAKAGGATQSESQ